MYKTVCYPKTDYISIIRLVCCHPTGHILVGMLPCFQIPFLVSVCQADTKILYLLIEHIVFPSWISPRKFRIVGLFSIIPVNCKLRNPYFFRPFRSFVLVTCPLSSDLYSSSRRITDSRSPPVVLDLGVASERAEASLVAVKSGGHRDTFFEGSSFPWDFSTGSLSPALSSCR